ncbi:hypothetical protein FRC08_006570 [Ceratobasidium sp. 394]|nr:hypothetical protein FRC08_006570 [Ceratobasidium sp. 394]
MPGPPLNPNDIPSSVGIDTTVKSTLAGWKAARASLSDTTQSYLSACVALRAVCISPSHRTLERASVEEALVTVDSELDSLATESNALHAMQTSLATMRNKSATLARVNTLPPEVLADIFVQSRNYCARNDDFNFCDIAGVCAYWREIALNTADLWTHIDVGPDTPSGMTSLLLARAKSTPVHIHVYEPEPSGSNPTSDYEVGKAANALKPYIQHVRALEIESHSYSRNFVGGVLNLWLDRGSQTLPRSLAISRPGGDQILSPDGITKNGILNSRSENAKGVLSSLDTLHLHGVHFDWDCGAYRGLVDLRLDCAGYSVSISISQLMSVLSANPNLAILKLKHLEISDIGDQSQPTPILLGNLRVLKLVDHHSTGLHILLPLITLPAASAELSVGIHCSDRIHNQLQAFITRSSISVLYLEVNLCESSTWQSQELVGL